MSKILVVTGSRAWRDISRIHWALINFQQTHSEDEITLRHGCASGADAIARSHAEFFGFTIEDYWPDYTSYDFATANKKRNIAMLEDCPNPTYVYAFPTKSSRGTWHCVKAARKLDIPVRIFDEEN